MDSLWGYAGENKTRANQGRRLAEKKARDWKSKSLTHQHEEFFALSQEDGEETADFWGRVERKAAEAHIHEMTVEDTIKNIVLRGISDTKMKKDVAKLNRCNESLQAIKVAIHRKEKYRRSQEGKPGGNPMRMRMRMNTKTMETSTPIKASASKARDERYMNKMFSSEKVCFGREVVKKVAGVSTKRKGNQEESPSTPISEGNNDPEIEDIRRKLNKAASQKYIRDGTPDTEDHCLRISVTVEHSRIISSSPREPVYIFRRLTDSRSSIVVIIADTGTMRSIMGLSVTKKYGLKFMDNHPHECVRLHHEGGGHGEIVHPTPWSPQQTHGGCGSVK